MEAIIICYENIEDKIKKCIIQRLDVGQWFVTCQLYFNKMPIVQ